MNNRLTEHIARALHELRIALRYDSYCLTRDDQDAIETQIDILEKFILDRCSNHGKD